VQKPRQGQHTPRCKVLTLRLLTPRWPVEPASCDALIAINLRRSIGPTYTRLQPGGITVAAGRHTSGYCAALGPARGSDPCCPRWLIPRPLRTVDPPGATSPPRRLHGGYCAARHARSGRAGGSVSTAPSSSTEGRPQTPTPRAPAPAARRPPPTTHHPTPDARRPTPGARRPTPGAARRPQPTAHSNQSSSEQLPITCVCMRTAGSTRRCGRATRAGASGTWPRSTASARRPSSASAWTRCPPTTSWRSGSASRRKWCILSYGALRLSVCL
jgi:hypothetical protein